MTEDITKKINDVEASKRKTTFVVSSLVVVGVLLSASIINFITNNRVDGFLELFLSLLFLSNILVVRTKINLDILSSILLYLTAGMLLRIVSVSSEIEIGSFAGLLGLLVVAYFLFGSLKNLILFPSILLMVLCNLQISHSLPLTIDNFFKYLVVYVAISVALIINRKIENNKNTEYSRIETKYSEVNAELESTLRNEQKALEETDRLNKMMVGRELKMIELKKRLKK